MATPSNYGQACGCGTITCGGACSSTASVTYGGACPASTGTAINVNEDYGNYTVQSIALVGAPPGIYTFYTSAGDAGSVTLLQNGQSVSTISYIWQTTVSGSNTSPVQSYTFTFPGYLNINVRAGSAFVNGTLNLYDMPGAIFDEAHYISTCCS